MNNTVTPPVNVPVNGSPKSPLTPPANSNPAIAQNIQAFHNVLRRMLSVDEKVSDLIFSPGRPPQVELSGELQGVPISGLERLTPPLIKAMADLMLMNNEQGLETLEKKGSTDISYSVNGLCRFRVNIFRQRGTYAVVMRVIPTTPPNWQDLDLPPGVMSAAELKNGLVLVT